MQEVLQYLRRNGYRTYIATGGFVRAFSERVYGIPPEQVSGSDQALEFDTGPNGPTLTFEPKFALSNTEAGKIENFVRRHRG